MDFPECQNCGAKLTRISERKQFAKCGHCGTVHNVSGWFSDSVPPLIVKERKRILSIDQAMLRLKLVIAMIVLFVGLGFFGVSFADYSTGLELPPAVTRIGGILLAVGSGTVLITLLLKNR